MSATATEVAPTKANIGVYTNPAHELWVAEAEPKLEDVQSGKHLKAGEVVVAIKSTGICGTREVDLQFQYRYANMWPRAIRLIRGGVIDVKKLTTHRFKLEDAPEAFKTAGDPKTGAIKVMIQSMD
ncbi:hypothetical protein FH972_021966 [Carpinus fangiana]|uniref:Uncharacterized protein n=1 Tax=Carpinus fangiana TaxID=176857 RepID=A0A5N6KR83_9ROSI|nr:hypothetical protein FH972_021966 [Carpinus fangiana]